MLKENKFRKYLLYATGEIILVVIGILIALSVNNCNQSLDQKKIEQNIYRDLIQELDTDLKEIKGERAYNQKNLSRYKRASEIILEDTNKKFIDTLAAIVIELTNFSDFKNDESAYKRLSVSGQINLLKNKNIINKLQDLGLLYNYINRLEKNQEQLMYIVVPKISLFLRVKPLQVMRPSELYDYKFHNNVVFFIKIGTEKDELYKKGEKELIALIDTLEKELQ